MQDVALYVAYVFTMLVMYAGTTLAMEQLMVKGVCACMPGHVAKARHGAFQQEGGSSSWWLSARVLVAMIVVGWLLASSLMVLQGG